MKERILEILQGSGSLNEKASDLSGMFENQKQSDSFWKHIVLTEDGKLDVEQVQKELADYYFMMEQVPLVYMHITNDRMSKTNYYAHAVMAVADDCQTEDTEKAIEDAIKSYRSDVERLTLEISDILHPNGDGPKQPALCDVAGYVRDDLAGLNKTIDDLKKVLQMTLPHVEENIRFLQSYKHDTGPAKLIVEMAKQLLRGESMTVDEFTKKHCDACDYGKDENCAVTGCTDVTCALSREMGIELLREESDGE